jgi:hypothetical protein
MLARNETILSAPGSKPEGESIRHFTLSMGKSVMRIGLVCLLGASGAWTYIGSHQSSQNQAKIKLVFV